MQKSLVDIGQGSDFFEYEPKSTDKSKWDCVKLISFCTANETTKRKSSPWNKRKCLQIIHPIRGWYPQYIRNTHNLITNKIWFKNGQRTWTDVFSKTYKWATGTFLNVHH